MWALSDLPPPKGAYRNFSESNDISTVPLPLRIYSSEGFPTLLRPPACSQRQPTEQTPTNCGLISSTAVSEGHAFVFKLSVTSDHCPCPAHPIVLRLPTNIPSKSPPRTGPCDIMSSTRSLYRLATSVSRQARPLQKQTRSVFSSTAPSRTIRSFALNKLQLPSARSFSVSAFKSHGHITPPKAGEE